MSDLKHQNFRTHEYITQLTLDRPPVNALNRSLIGELNTALNDIQAEIDTGSARVLLINAAGKHFCAGADLKERQQIPANQVESVVNNIRTTFQSIYELPIPVIAAIKGSALGGGLELALAADLRIVSENARVGLPETGLAIIPGGGGTQRLPRIIGYTKAFYWIATGKLFTGREAVEAGAADFIVDNNELHAFSMELAQSIAANGPIAVQAAKQAMREGYHSPIKQALEIERKYYGKIIYTDDRLEGIKAFMEKRNPEYRGK